MNITVKIFLKYDYGQFQHTDAKIIKIGTITEMTEIILKQLIVEKDVKMENTFCCFFKLNNVV